MQGKKQGPVLNRVFLIQFGAAFLAAPVVWGVFIVFSGVGSGLFHFPIQARPWSFLLLTIAYPVCEEIVFRGLLQGGMRTLRMGRSRAGPLTLANVFTSVVFTALHYITHPPLATMAVMAPSLVFGYFRDRYDGRRILRIGAPIALHVWYNFGYYLLFGVAGK